MPEFTFTAERGNEREAFQALSEALAKWSKENQPTESDYADAASDGERADIYTDSDAYLAEADAESFSRLWGCEPSQDALAQLQRDGVYRQAYDDGFAVFEIRYAE